MKTIFSSLSILVMLFLSSCTGKTNAVVKNVSENKHVTTTITANRQSSVDAFKVDMNVKAYDFKDGKLEFEVYADDLNDQNVKFNWKDADNCVITIVQGDKSVRTFNLIASPQQLQLAEVNS